MTDAAPRPLTGLELSRAALVGLSAAVVAAPLVAWGDLPAHSALAPRVPAWLAWGGSLALFAAAASLAFPRLRGGAAMERNRVRRELGVRVAMLSMLAGAFGAPAAAAVLLPSGTADGPGVGLLILPLVPAGGMLGATLGAASVGGVRGRIEAASWGAGLGCVFGALTLGTGCLLIGVTESPLGLSAALAFPLFLVPAVIHPDDAFDGPPLP